MTKIISLCNIKGGTGKTTAACHLAYFLRLVEGRSVGFIDCDRQNLSSYNWLSGSALEAHLTNLTKVDDEERFFEELNELKGKCDFIIVDTQSGLSEVNKLVVSVSDYVVVPLQPHLLDLDSSLKIVKYITNLKKFTNMDNPHLLCFLNRCVPNTNLTSEAEAYMRSELTKIFIPVKWFNRQAYADAPVQKDFLFLEGRNPKARNEVTNLCKYIYKQVEGV